MNHKGVRNRLLCLGIAVALGGCGNLVGKPELRPALYDLGLGEPLASAPAILPTRIEVRAPSWLASAAMQYRLDYQQPAQRQTFAESRWASPPAEMLERKLARALAAAPVAPDEGGCRLRIELDEFAQVFEQAQASHAIVLARAELLPARGETVIARRTLAIREAAPSLDARGGVIAHQKASARFVRELAAWLAAPGSGHEAGAAAACRR